MEDEEAATWKRFSPIHIDPKLCQARTWNCGHGGQCPSVPSDASQFCLKHRFTWRVHGRVDGQIPKSKLEEFEKHALKQSSSAAAAPKATGWIGKRDKGQQGAKSQASGEPAGDGVKLERGVRVSLCGLETQPQLNGCHGICLGPANDGSGRLIVSLDCHPPEQFNRLRPENLKVLPPAKSCSGGARKKPHAQDKRLQFLERQNKELKKRCQAKKLDRRDVVRGIADLELEPLKQVNVDQRRDCKRKLLLKWHPDKAVSPRHLDLATEVTQELQNRPEWND